MNTKILKANGFILFKEIKCKIIAALYAAKRQADTVTINEDGKYKIFTRSIKDEKKDVPAWSKGILGNKERKAFCNDNKIEFKESTNEILDSLIYQWIGIKNIK